MDLIVCLDDDNGMKFNHRRQSRDQKVIEDILSSLNDKKLYATEESRILFSADNTDIIYVSNTENLDGCFFAESALIMQLAKVL